MCLALIVLLSIHAGTAHAQEETAVEISQHAEFGDILTDAGGNTLYLFTEDERNKSNCSGGCALAWPPLLTVGDPTAGEGVNASRLGTFTREDGATQVTYNGWPLYYFASDEKPGDTKGQYGTWFVVSAFDGPIQNNAAVNTAENAEFGTMLVEASGRSLYLFTEDERNKSNCSGGCAGAWPPLLTVGDPTAGEGVNADRLGTFAREDGSTQVAYNGWPLYYFAADEKPGDTKGQYGTWFVVSAFGGPIQNNAAVNTAENAEFGTMLADASGRSLYVFTQDELNVSNCTGGCALAWPPLLTMNNPRGEGSVPGAWLSTITRPDGSSQVTYFNGIPLYYFAKDDKPGDTNGQTIGDVWFVVSPIGEAIGMTASAPPAGSGGPAAPALPITGDTAVNVIARWSLVASLILISTGGLILVRRRRRIVAGAREG